MGGVVDGWWMLATVVAAAVASCLFNLLVRLVWRPRAVARRLRAQGVRGPERSSFLHGNLGDVRRFRAEGAGLTLDVSDHDFTPIAQPQFRKWIPLYGNLPTPHRNHYLASSGIFLCVISDYRLMSRAHVPVLVRVNAGDLRGRRRRGEACVGGPDGAVPQAPDQREPAPAAGGGARAGQRRRLASPQEGGAPGLQHRQAQGTHAHPCYYVRIEARTDDCLPMPPGPGR
jgi:hypothetical protein